MLKKLTQCPIFAIIIQKECKHKFLQLYAQGHSKYMTCKTEIKLLFKKIT